MANEPGSDSSVGSAAGGTVRVEGFVVSDLIGTGGYSRVYRARQIGFDREVALKVLSVGIETDDQQHGFERECRAMGVLSQHPNIVTVFNAAVTADRQPSIAMELYSGGTLGDQVRASGPLEVSDLLDIGIRISGALQTAHDRGVVHRDIKPQNLFVSEYGQPALGDFGISSFDDDRTVTGAGGGLTVHYAPPELIEGEAATPASDVYSLAASLFTLGSGQHPFPRHEGQTIGELARRILVQPAPRFEGPLVLGDLLERAMAKSPHERPASAAEFGKRLQEIQRQLGLAETQMVLASDTKSSAPALQAEAVADDSETAASSTVNDDLSAPVDNRRVARGLLAAGLACVAAIVAVAVLAGPPRTPPDVEDATPVTIDEFFSTPAVPTGVLIERAPDETSVVLNWNQSEGARSYQVERLDTGDIVEVLEPEAVIEVAFGMPVCVSVVAVGLDGKLSAPTPTTCSD